jgi:hypothetical protein
MFDLATTFKIKPSKVVVTDIDGQIIRRARFTLEKDFDYETASGMGVAAGNALDLVEDRSATQVVIPIDSIHAEMTIKVDGQSVTIGQATGVKATIKAPKVPKNEDDEEGSPTLKLEFETGMTDDVWLLLGRKAGSWADVKITKNQLELGLPEPKATNGKAAAGAGGDPKALGDSLGEVSDASRQASLLKPPKGKGKRKSSHGDDRADAAGELNPQAAASPQEAEEVRAQAQREQDQADAGVWSEEMDSDDKKAAPGDGADGAAF